MKVKCGMCVNELSGKCVVKKVTVKPNKSRKCNEYSIDSQREIERIERKASLRDRADAKAKEATAHPVTGDLSRFKTTASE